jgi:hypothetical protein
MSTQIFINNNKCKPEFTKIVTHSLGFEPSLDDNRSKLLCGGSKTLGYYGLNGVIWSDVIYDTGTNFISPTLTQDMKTIGIPSPINLVAEDVVTISGTMFFNEYKAWIDAGFNLDAIVGVYYFDCSDTSSRINGYTFIPVKSFNFDTQGNLCFETSVTLNSNFDIHTTRFIVGFNIFASCEGCLAPEFLKNLVTVSYTLDIERPCYVDTTTSNFIIKNCCEPIITELVNAPGLVVGNFYNDNEGNCWEVVSNSTDVTNFTRVFVDTYVSCVECQASNPCPENLVISSCCIEGQEYVSSSLPGLEIGDTFVDNNGLCWSVNSETSAPITEESITVDTIIMGGCEECKTANPCPSFWSVRSCCGEFGEIIASSVPLNQFDSFVDTNGICWTVSGESNQLPTNYGIIVDTVYTGAVEPETNCDLCITANTCPEEYFLTVRACCDTDRVEVISIPAQYMTLSEGTIFSDPPYNLCWEVMSYATTGVETYAVDWSKGISTYRSCEECTSKGREGKLSCVTVWQVRNCADNTVYIAASINNVLTVGLFYTGYFESTEEQSCFEVLGYGYPNLDPNIVVINRGNGLVDCIECSLALPGLKTVELQPCCGGPNINATTAASVVFQFGSNSVYSLTTTDVVSQCYTLIGYSTAVPSTEVISINKPFDTSDPAECLANFPCG